MTKEALAKAAVVLAMHVLAIEAGIAALPAAVAETAVPGFIRVANEQPLPPDEAFKLKASFRGPNTVVVELTPATNHYLYKDKVRFAVKNSGSVLINEVRLPLGEVKNDQFFGTMEVYKKPFQAEITLDRNPKAKGFTLLAMYQGCDEKIGVCYPPLQKSFDLLLP